MKNSVSPVADILDLTLVKALERMQAGEFSAVEYVQAMLERNREVARLNAVVYLDEPTVLEAAAQRDRQRRDNGNPELLGAPLLLKDNINTVNLPTTGCTPALKGHVPPADAPVAGLLLNAGAVIFGKSNMHELAFGVTNNNPAFGPARNPYNPDLIPGGSSGGAAVAIAAGILPAGLGSDTGGSTRLPAAFCGICGFRPTIGRYPASGVIPISATRDTPGPMARAVGDLQLLDRVMAGDPAPVERVSLAEARLGIPRAYYYENLEPGVADVIEATLDLLAASCKDLVEVDLDGVADLNDKVSFPVVLYEARRDMIQYLADFAPGISIDDILAQIASPDVKQAYDAVVSGTVSEAVYDEAVQTWRPQLQALYSDCFRHNALDALVVPATPLTAPPVGHDDTVELNGSQHPTMATIIRSTDPSGNAGIPSLCVATGLAPNGLPAGICLDGPVGTDRRLLAIGKALQDEIGFLPRPDLSRGRN